MPDQPDELAAQGVGVADHFLSRNTLVLGSGGTAFGGFSQNLLVGRADVLHTGEQNGEQVMQQGLKKED